MVKLKKLVETEEAMEKFIADYRIPPNVSLRYCKEEEWHLKRRTGEVVIPFLVFIERGMRIPMDGGKSQSSREEDEAPRAQKQVKIGHQGQGKRIDA